MQNPTITAIVGRLRLDGGAEVNVTVAVEHCERVGTQHGVVVECQISRQQRRQSVLAERLYRGSVFDPIKATSSQLPN